MKIKDNDLIMISSFLSRSLKASTQAKEIIYQAMNPEPPTTNRPTITPLGTAHFDPVNMKPSRSGRRRKGRY